MYIGMTDLVNIHRHIRVIGKELSKDEIGFVREQMKLAKETDLVPNGVLAGYPIKAVVNKLTEGKKETTITLEVKDNEETV